jgi:hypothetical protein
LRLATLPIGLWATLPIGKLRRTVSLKQLQKFIASKLCLFENIAQCSLRNVPRVKSDDSSPLGIILVPQEVVAAFDAINHKASSLQGGEHFSRRDLRQPAHARASLTGTISLIVFRGSASEGGTGQPFSW